MNTFQIIFLCIVALLAILMSYLFLCMVKRVRKLEGINKKRDEIVIKALQEAAYDYHVRIIKSGKGDLYIGDEEVDQVIPEFEFLDMGSDNKFTCQVTFNLADDSGKLFIINYKLFGNCYMAYSADNVVAWANVVRKARRENLRTFNGKLGRYR